MRRIATAATLALTLAACQDATEPEPRPPGVSLAPDTLRLQAGLSGHLAATVIGADGAVHSASEIEWTSADPTIAEVGPDGAVSAVREGGTTITASVGDHSASANVQVELDGRYRIVSVDGEALPTAIGTITCGIEDDHSATYVLDSGLMTFQGDYFSAREFARYECSNGAHQTDDQLLFGSYALSRRSIRFFDADGDEQLELAQARVEGDSIVMQWVVGSDAENATEPFVVDAVLRRQSP